MEKIQYKEKTTGQNQDNQQQSQPRKYNNYSNNRNYNNNNNYNNGYKKPRFQNKDNRYKNKHGFDYDQTKIGYNTEIPEMPEKLKNKPDDTKYNKKVDDLEIKASELKKKRKQIKDTYKNGNQGFRKQIEQQKSKITLGRACLFVLNFDKDELEKQIGVLQSKIDNYKRKIEYITKPANQQGSKNIKIDEMNYAQLVREQERVTVQISTASLTKAQEVELHNRLQKITKRKLQVPKQKLNSNEDLQKQAEVQSHKDAIERLRNVKSNFEDKMTDIDSKIEAIIDDIADFEQVIEDIHQKERNTDNSTLLEQAAQLKEQIITIWNEIDQLKQQHNTKLSQFEYEQQKIKYIQWAKQIKAKKAEQWELEKQERKKLKLRQKEKTKKGDQKTDKKQGDQTTQEKPQYERKKINRNQKQIDSCAFLIQYCKDLSAATIQNEQKSNVQKQVKLQDALKKGQWAKMKNVQVIQGKKHKNDEQVEHKVYKKKQNKNVVVQPVDRFSHTYFVAQIFDSVKVLPPIKQQQLEKTINDLEDKMEYYIAHPDQGIEKSLLPQGKQSERDTKGRRKIINTEQFPSLR